jgi:hypothetical protein
LDFHDTQRFDEGGRGAPIRRGKTVPVLPRQTGSVFASGATQGNKRMSNRQAYLALPILNIFVPQVGHTPWVAGLPFFIVISLVSFISRLALHLTQ